MTDEDKEEYIRCCKEKEKIEIDKEEVCKNPGLRNIAKIMLNSFWGKFAQRDDLTKSKYCYEAHEFYELLMDDTLEVLDAHFFSNHLLYTTYRTKEAFTHSSKNANIFIAAFTTAWARLKLYTLLEQLGERALYFNTDSVIYSVKSGEWRPDCGVFLGELTNELNEGDWITDFVSAGPKNYAF